MNYEKIYRGYKLCKKCGCPMLKKGQTRKHPDEYRHASGCPDADKDYNPLTTKAAE